MSERTGAGAPAPAAHERLWERRFDAVLGIAASAILMGMMLLTFVDVVGRYVFNRPVRGGFEVTELGLLVLIFAGLPLVSHADEHVTMDFIDRLLRPGARALLERAVDALCAAIFFFGAWLVWLKADRIWEYRDATDVLRIVYGPFVYFMAVMIALTGADPSLQGVRAAMTEGLLGLAAMLVLMFVRVPIALAMAIVGIVGYAYARDWNWTIAFAVAQTKIYETGRNYTLSVVPLFILMGSFTTRAGMSQELFRAAYAFIGHLRGGLAMATILACAGFGAICGSSIATAATMSKVAYPSMKRFGYSDALATGAIASGGTLGILIPPSTIMVIYGVFTETNIGKLFAAGILPGILAATLLCVAVAYVTWRDPQAGPPGERATLARALDRRSRDIWPVAAAVPLRAWAASTAACSPPPRAPAMGAFGAMAFALWRAGAVLARALRLSRRERAHHRDDLHDPDRRADVRRVREHHQHAERPEGVRAALQPEPDPGGRGDLRDLRDPRHRDGGAVDDPPHHPGVLPAGRAAWASTRCGSAS